MSKYIDTDKLKKFKEELADIIVSSQGVCTYQDCKDIAERETLLLIATLQQKQLDQTECVWIHKKYNREYRIVSDNARLKNSNGEWIDCVIYAPLYENKFEMFAREKDSFYKEFEKK